MLLRREIKATKYGYETMLVPPSPICKSINVKLPTQIFEKPISEKNACLRGGDQVLLHLLGQQVTLDGDHDVVKVLGGDVSLAGVIASAERDIGVLVVEVVQELAELRVGDFSTALLAKVQPDEVAVEGEGKALVQRGLLYYAAKFL